MNSRRWAKRILESNSQIVHSNADTPVKSSPPSGTRATHREKPPALCSCQPLTLPPEVWCCQRWDVREQLLLSPFWKHLEGSETHTCEGKCWLCGLCLSAWELLEIQMQPCPGGFEGACAQVILGWSWCGHGKELKTTWVAIIAMRNQRGLPSPNTGQ